MDSVDRRVSARRIHRSRSKICGNGGPPFSESRMLNGWARFVQNIVLTIAKFYVHYSKCVKIT